MSRLFPVAPVTLVTVALLAGGCRPERAGGVPPSSAARPATREPAKPAASNLSAELAAALPLLEAAAPGGCATPPAGLPPRLRVDAACRVQVAVVTRGDAAAIERRITDAGGVVTRRGGDPLTLQAWAPPALVRAMAADPDVAAVRAPTYARPLGAGGSPSR